MGRYDLDVELLLRSDGCNVPGEQEENKCSVAVREGRMRGACKRMGRGWLKGRGLGGGGRGGGGGGCEGIMVHIVRRRRNWASRVMWTCCKWGDVTTIGEEEFVLFCGSACLALFSRLVEWEG